MWEVLVTVIGQDEDYQQSFIVTVLTVKPLWKDVVLKVVKHESCDKEVSAGVLYSLSKSGGDRKLFQDMLTNNNISIVITPMKNVPKLTYN